MTSASGLYLEKARQSLGEAHAISQIGLFESAGRAAYLAAHHAAQAFIFDRTGRIAKTHSGVRSEFARLAKDDPRIDRALLKFLGQAYNLKAIADYAIGDDAGLTQSEAEEAIGSAERFIDCIVQLLSAT